jgi:hypothetical protein
MKRKFCFKALALALAVAIPSLVLAENLGEAEASGRPFWGKKKLEMQCIMGARAVCTQQYIFWIAVGTPDCSGQEAC